MSDLKETNEILEAVEVIGAEAAKVKSLPTAIAAVMKLAEDQNAATIKAAIDNAKAVGEELKALSLGKKIALGGKVLTIVGVIIDGVLSK